MYAFFSSRKHSQAFLIVSTFNYLIKAATSSYFLSLPCLGVGIERRSMSSRSFLGVSFFIISRITFNTPRRRKEAVTTAGLSHNKKKQQVGNPIFSNTGSLAPA
jgi:hypothetical protein